VYFPVSNTAGNLNEHLVERIQNKPSAIQKDEATDSDKDPHVIMYAKCLDKGKIKEDLVFCK
jgi:hypothetical protein